MQMGKREGPVALTILSLIPENFGWPERRLNTTKQMHRPWDTSEVGVSKPQQEGQSGWNRVYEKIRKYNINIL